MQPGAKDWTCCCGIHVRTATFIIGAFELVCFSPHYFALVMWKLLISTRSEIMLTFKLFVRFMKWCFLLLLFFCVFYIKKKYTHVQIGNFYLLYLIMLQSQTIENTDIDYPELHFMSTDNINNSTTVTQASGEIARMYNIWNNNDK